MGLVCPWSALTPAAMIARESRLKDHSSLAAFLIRRILTALPVLAGMATLVFLIARVLPGDPASLYLSPGISPAAADAARHSLGLDRPLVEQYGDWLHHVAVCDFGSSLVRQRRVSSLIADTLPNSLLLGGTAFLLELLLGTAAALAAARRPGSRIDGLVGGASMALYATPGFFLGTLLLIVFSYRLGWFPTAQMYSVGSSGLGPLDSFLDLGRHLILPALTSCIPGAAGFTRYLRSNLLQTLDRPFILAARSHGLSESKILLRYALPNAAIPAISLGGLEMGTLLTGTLVTETLFAWPGMGRLTVGAVLARDYPLLIGCTLVSGFIIIIANILADTVHAILDPRVRLP